MPKPIATPTGFFQKKNLTHRLLLSGYQQSIKDNHLMRLSEWFTPGSPCKRFDTHERLFEGLRKLDNAAILCLQVKGLPMVKKIVAGYCLESDKAGDIINSATLIFLQKIGSGAYQFQGHAPMTYFIEIAKRQALMATRSLKKATQRLDDLPETADPDAADLLRRQDAADTVRHMLDQLGQPCADVIRLHHIDGYSDEEVVKMRFTKYSTPDSLKMKRSDCMKKLVQIATQWKTSINT